MWKVFPLGILKALGLCHQEVHVATGVFAFFLVKKINELISLFLVALFFLPACAFSSLWRVGAPLQLWCSGFSFVGLGSRCMGFSNCGPWALECSLSGCGAWAQLLHSMRNLSRPGIEPVSPAFADGFLSTVPSGKSLGCLLSYLCF